MTIAKQLLVGTAICLLSGCATIVSGTDQQLSVDTPDVVGARCSLTDTKSGTWTIEETPGTATVVKGNGPMKISCKKAGYKTGAIVLQETVAAPVLGNVILGGGVGILVDAASGAAQNYPESATVWMEPASWSSSKAKDEWMAKKAAYEAKVAAQKEAMDASSNPPPSQQRY